MNGKYFGFNLALILIIILSFYTLGFYSKKCSVLKGQNDFKDENVSNDVEQISRSDYDGWKTYRNEEYQFEFKYPPYALLAEEEGFTVGTKGLLSCIKINFLYGYIYISLNESPCGITGGDWGKGEEKEELLSINGKTVKATGHLFYTDLDDVQPEMEVLQVKLSKNIVIQYLSETLSNSLTYEEYLTRREGIIKTIESFKNLSN